MLRQTQFMALVMGKKRELTGTFIEMSGLQISKITEISQMSNMLERTFNKMSSSMILKKEKTFFERQKSE
jgi:cell division inhibitor SulA